MQGKLIINNIYFFLVLFFFIQNDFLCSPYEAELTALPKLACSILLPWEELEI